MKKLFAFEVRKLIYGKSFKVCILVLSLIVVFSLATVAQLTKTSEKELELGDKDKGVVLSVEGEQEYSGKYILTSVVSGQVPLILSVFIALFIAADFSQGIIKNTIVKGYSRNSIFLSKTAITIVSTIIFTVLCMAIACGIGTAIWGFGGKIDIELVVILFSQLLVTCAMSCFYMLIAMIVRKTGASIAVSVVSMTILNMLISFFANVVDKPSIKDYHLPNILASISSVTVADHTLARTMSIATVYIIIFSMISLIHFRKTDIL